MENLKFRLDDRTGFPMLHLPELNGYLHWLPVTKIQFEYFICDEPDDHFGEQWYAEIRRQNPRVSPNDVRAENYWHAFLTGITPQEARRFARWSGADYALPTLDEWCTAWQTLKRYGAVPREQLVNVIE